MNQIEEYSKKIYTTSSEINLTTVKAIARKEAKLNKVYIHKDMLGDLWIDGEKYEICGDSPEEEVLSVIKFCNRVNKISAWFWTS